MCRHVFVSAGHVLCVSSVRMSVPGESGKGKGSVSGGSGLTAGYDGDTPNSQFICLTGPIQYTCI